MTTPYSTITPRPARHSRAATRTTADKRALRRENQVMGSSPGRSFRVDDFLHHAADLRRGHVLVPDRLLGIDEALLVDLGGGDDLDAGLEDGGARIALLGFPELLVVGHRFLGGLADR